MDSRRCEMLPDRFLLEQGLRFLARQTSTQSHELTNVLNIINEFVGLLNDMVGAFACGRSIEPARFKEIVAKTQRQVQRGETIIRGINQLAHSVDSIIGTLPLAELNARVTFLAGRLLRLDRARLTVSQPEPDVALVGYVLGYQQAVLTAMELALEAGAENHALELRFETSPNNVEIIIEADVPLDPSAAPREHERALQELVSSLGGCLVHRHGAPADRQITLTFPCQQNTVDPTVPTGRSAG
jgi:hypothetical protein